MTEDRGRRRAGQDGSRSCFTSQGKGLFATSSKGEFFIITAVVISIVIFTNYRFLQELNNPEMSEYGQDQILFVRNNLIDEVEQTENETQLRELLVFAQPELSRRGYVLGYKVFDEGGAPYQCANVTIGTDYYDTKFKACNG